ncbi:MAG: hypothetical protein R3Y43_02765 [Alphaproteobacteria bacterium]
MSIKEKLNKAKKKAKRKIGNIAIKAAILTSVFTGVGVANASAQEKSPGETLKDYKEFVKTTDDDNIRKTATSSPENFLEGLEMFDEYMTFGEIKSGSRVDEFIATLQSFKEENPEFYNNVTESMDNLSIAFLSYLDMDNQKDANTQGYDMGNYDMSFTINKNGDISHLQSKSDNPTNEAHLKLINEAMSREKGLGVDRKGWHLDASSLVTEMKVKQIIEKKQANGEIVTNGDAFLKKLDKKISSNGLQINDNGRLEPTKENLKKPLKTENDLFQEYKVKVAKERAAFMK